MANTVGVEASPKIAKHVDADSFIFKNDLGRVIEAGETVKVEKLVGVTNVPILEGELGQAQLIGGPVTGYRMYFLGDAAASAPAADIAMGGVVTHPVSNEYLGIAVHHNIGIDVRGLSEEAYQVGDKLITYLALPEPGAGTLEASEADQVDAAQAALEADQEAGRIED